MRKNTDHRRTAEREIEIFRQFVAAAHLDIDTKTIQKREPPEPDIRCVDVNNRIRAFELVEICNPHNASLPLRAHRLHRYLFEALNALDPTKQEAFRARFNNHPLSFNFATDVSTAFIQPALPTVLEDLIVLPEMDGCFSGFSTARARAAVRFVRSRGRLNDPDDVNFNIGGSFEPSDVLCDAILSKLSKTYRTDCFAIELLAHRGAYAFPSPEPLRQIAQVVALHGLGPFQRIWLHDWHCVLRYP